MPHISVKMLEGRTGEHNAYGCGIDDSKYDLFYKYCEDNEIVIVSHIGGPEGAWHEGGRLYGTHPDLNDLYKEVDNVLTKFPKLKLVLAHFYFITEHIDKAADVLDKWENVYFDLTPNQFMYLDFQKQPKEWKKFFEKYQDRIMYGTDIGSRCVLADNAENALNEDECLARMDLIDGLFDENTNRIMREDGRYLINTDDFVQKGFSLSEEALNKIYWENFESYVGEKPARVNPKLIIKECKRINTTLKIMSFIDKSTKPDMSVTKDAIAFFNKTK